MHDAKEFFDKLPAEMTPEEEVVKWELVRICIRLSRLKQGNVDGRVTLSSLKNNFKFQQCLRNAYPDGVNVESWLQYRVWEHFDSGLIEKKISKASVECRKRKIGGELKYEQDVRQFVVWMKEDGLRNEKTPDEWAEWLEAEVDAWFAEMPEEGFTSEEEEFRSSLVQLLAARPKKESHFQSLMQDSRVKNAKSECLPMWIPTPEWVERRIGEEITCSRESQMMVLHELAW